MMAMLRRITTLVMAACCILASTASADERGRGVTNVLPTPSRAAQERVSESYGKLPLQFEANQGQAGPQVKFLSRGNGYSLLLAPTEVVLALSRPANHKGAKTFLATSQIEEQRTTKPSVHAIAPDSSPYGAADLATTIIFTDPTITVGSTIIKAVHFTELRTAVSAVRTLAGLTAFSFTDATLTPGSTTVKAVHLTELRTALNGARVQLLLPAIGYANPGTAGTLIRAADINELRNGVK